MLNKYVIERDVPGIGRNTPDGFCAIAQQSKNSLMKLGPGVQWLESFIVADKTYCVYLAENEEIIRAHARDTGFPANRIEKVATVLDLSMAPA
jgi:hypothetical protein